MKANTNVILSVMNVLFWIIFIGLCINTGTLLTSFFVSIFINPEAADRLWQAPKLGELYQYSFWHYSRIVSLMISMSALKAFMAYLVVKIFMQFDFSAPFQPEISATVARISHLALATGILAILANAYGDWLTKRGMPIEDNWGSAELLFFAGILYILSEIFKKGTSIQSENELTI